MLTVVLGALIEQGRVLLVHRRPEKRANPDVWDLPGGLVKAGESELTALARELREELNVQIAADSASPLCRAIATPAGEPLLVSAWLVGAWQGAPANAAPEEHDGLQWFTADQLPPPPHIIVRAALVEAMRGHAG